MTVQFSDEEEAEFSEAEERRAGNFDPLPDGTYVCEVTDAKTHEKGGKRMLTWTLRVLHGEYAGRLVWRNNMLETKNNKEWLKRDLHVCGVVLTKLSEVNDLAPNLIGLKLEIGLKTKLGSRFAEVYLNKLVTGGNGVSTPEPSEDKSTDDTVPF